MSHCSAVPEALLSAKGAMKSEAPSAQGSPHTMTAHVGLQLSRFGTSLKDHPHFAIPMRSAQVSV